MAELLEPLEPHKTQTLAGALERILEPDRSHYNARFAEARRRVPKLDAGSFADLLQRIVAPIVEAVYQEHPERTTMVTQALYDLALDLCGQELLGVAARSPAITRGWVELLPCMPNLIATDPRRVAGAMTNALYVLSAEPTARPQAWIDRMSVLAGHCDDVSALLMAGQVVAWCAGLAHYRPAALALCRQLDPALVRICLGVPAGNTAIPVDQIIEQMAANPWLLPENAGRAGSRSLQIVKRAGAFRGLGGPFITPPTVTFHGADFVVADGEGIWLLTADIFGATFHRVDIAPQTGPPVSTSGFKVVRGTISMGPYSQTFPEMEVVTSLAANETTLAVTTPLSHAVYLVAVI